MNIEEAIHSHQQWKLMVESLFRGQRTFQIDPSILIKDNLCKLGQWIYSEDSNEYSNSHYFDVLKIAHREFHKQAGTILSLYDASKVDEAKMQLSKFQETSETVINLLNTIQQQSDS